MDKETAPFPLALVYNPSIRKEGGIERLLTVCLVGQYYTPLPYYQGSCILDTFFLEIYFFKIIKISENRMIFNIDFHAL